MSLTLDKASLNSKLKGRISGDDVTLATKDTPKEDRDKIDAVGDIAKIIAEEVDAYVKPLLDAHNELVEAHKKLVEAYNSHTHAGVLINATGQVVPIFGSSQIPSKTV